MENLSWGNDLNNAVGIFKTNLMKTFIIYYFN